MAKTVIIRLTHISYFDHRDSFYVLLNPEANEFTQYHGELGDPSGNGHHLYEPEPIDFPRNKSWWMDAIVQASRAIRKGVSRGS